MFLERTAGGLVEPLSGRRWDRKTVIRQVRSRVANLQKRGVKRGHLLFIHHGNRIEFFADLLDQDALILFTSGTTGDPKGVVHTHRSLRARWLTLQQSLGIEEYRRTLCLLPTHFGHGIDPDELVSVSQILNLIEARAE